MTAGADIATIDAAVPVVEVVVMEDRARVVRRGRVELRSGQSRVRVAGVAPVLVDKSLLARAGGGVEVIDASATREVAPWFEDAPDERAAAAALAALRERRDQARDQARAQADDSAVAAAAADALDQLVTVALDELADEAAWGRAAPDAAARLAELTERAGAAHRDAAGLAVDAARAAAEVERLDAEVATREAELGVETAAIAVDLVAAAAAAVELTIEYVVPCACWRPYHTATLRDDQLEVATDACVWQATGEDWNQVKLRFSTERPSLGTRPPELVDDLLSVRPRGALVVEARDQAIAHTGAGAAREADEVPGVDDGGTARLLDAPQPATVPSDGQPYRVRIGSFTSDAEVAYVAMPELAQAAILRTRAVNRAAEPVLAGPVDLVRDGGPTGRTQLLFVAPGERFDLGWGPDPAVRVHRSHRDKRDEAGVLGSWDTITHRVAIRLSNLGGTARTVRVTERIPVSEVEQVEVRLSRASAWQLEDDDGERRDTTPLCSEREVGDDGMITWTVELPGRQQRAIALEYVMKVHGSVAGL